ncbi:MAG: hypothetical protein Ct9H300mP28_09280 [Pseudomonadota bacterium]|nr:MAG: hypothetical protein Ct9H300mP28_09280 [Pseudomonadota bacterium]
MPRIIKKEDIQGNPQIPGFQIKSVTETLNQDSKVMEVKRLILDPNILVLNSHIMILISYLCDKR